MGIHQGAPWSMILYQLFNDNLLKRLQESRFGCTIGDIIVTCPAFADDITLLAMSKYGLQSLMDVAYNYSKKWNYMYNVEKCAVVIFGKDKSPLKLIKLGNTEIKVSNSEPHLGIILTCDKKEVNKVIKKRVDQCKQMCLVNMGLGSISVPINPAISSKVYYQAIIPKVTYGLEVLPIENADIELLENSHCNSAKIFQQLPIQTAGIGATNTIGWRSIESYMDIMCLMFIWRMLLLPTTCIYKMVLLVRIADYLKEKGMHMGPTWRVLNLCKKYSLYDYLISAVSKGEYISINKWKTIVYKSITKYDVKRWKVSCALYSSLAILYKDISDQKGLAWWKFAKHNPLYIHKVKLIVKLLLNVHSLRSCSFKCKSMEDSDQRCRNCNLYLVETPEHVLFQCISSINLRERAWVNVIENCVENLSYEISGMSPKISYYLF